MAKGGYETVCVAIIHLASLGAIAVARTPEGLLLGIAGIFVSAALQLRGDTSDRDRGITFWGAIGSVLLGFLLKILYLASCAPVRG